MLTRPHALSCLPLRGECGSRCRRAGR
jgi:hypothetical protein